ncbi:hypothetical protein [Desulfovibrio sp. JC010]|uniref:hypothetical protein n=1 Tax=Desulfovibrio sp. JC010 TaxID=2593641 RepID=UPI0013D8066B|nr:hypothetical protein [Desulfovibrio sp. JC010]NDV28524.1 hypothetical protein [Desulfovibrio sp. JC010]
MKKLLLCLILLLSFAQPAPAQDKLEVLLLVDRPLQPEAHLYRVLDLALKNQDEPYSIKIEVIKASQPRRIKIVDSSPKDYVIALGNRREHEENLQPVYVPILLGLGIGQRIMLTRPDVEKRLKRVRSLDDLKEFTFAQGLGWSDVKILRDAGLTVQTPANPASIPGMIMRHRVEIYPRGLFEIDLEYKRYSPDHPELVIDDYLVLSYPLASFFYVRKGNSRLHSAIERGLKKAYYTGQLQDLIMSDPVYSKTLRDIHPGKRVKIEIPVKDVSENTLSALKKFTFYPGKKIGEAIRK